MTRPVLPGRAPGVRTTVARTAHPGPTRSRVAPPRPPAPRTGHPRPLRVATTAGPVPGAR